MIDRECPKCHRIFKRKPVHVRHEDWMCRECYIKDLKENGRSWDNSARHKIKLLAQINKIRRQNLENSM